MRKTITSILKLLCSVTLLICCSSCSVGTKQLSAELTAYRMDLILIDVNSISDVFFRTVHYCKYSTDELKEEEIPGMLMEISDEINELQKKMKKYIPSEECENDWESISAEISTIFETVQKLSSESNRRQDDFVEIIDETTPVFAKSVLTIQIIAGKHTS